MMNETQRGAAIMLLAVGLLVFFATVVVPSCSQMLAADRKEALEYQERRSAAETCRYIMGYDGSKGELASPAAPTGKDPFHQNRLAAACSHQVMEKGGTVDDAVKQCFPVIDACEKGLVQ
jgi:hypothetical protein